jgi:hypothetical protein
MRDDLIEINVPWCFAPVVAGLGLLPQRAQNARRWNMDSAEARRLHEIFATGQNS